MTDQIYNTNANGIITDPGKFEREPRWVPEFWNRGLDGGASEDEGGVWFFVVDAEDRAKWPELAKVHGVALEETEQGFIYSAVYATAYEFTKAIATVIGEDGDDCEDQIDDDEDAPLLSKTQS